MRARSSTRARSYSFEARPLAGTEGAFAPFFSPDGEWVGLFVEDELKRVSLSGGGVLTVAQVADPYGADWSEDGRIAVIEEDGRSFGIVAQGGGVPDRSRTSPAYGHYPRWLPGGRTVLCSSLSEIYLCAIDVESREKRSLVRRGDTTAVVGTNPRFLTGGHLVYTAADANVVLGARFDPSSLELLDEPVPLLSGVRREQRGAAQMTTSAGTLVYAEGGHAAESSFVWATPEGAEALPLPPGMHGHFDLSPDGRRLVYMVQQPDKRHQLWFYDLETGARQRWPGTIQGLGLPVWDEASTSVVAVVSDEPNVLLRVTSYRTVAC